MILEMHCHTAEHSHCSHVAVVDLVQNNFEKGLEGTVLTDHQYLWPPEEIRELRHLLKVPDYYLILSGQEVETPEIGDVLVYGADESIEKGTSLELIRKRFPKAAIIWAHPYRHENKPSREDLFHPLIDGIEIFNSNHTVVESHRGLQDWHRYKFTAIAGTDTHALSYAGLYPTIFDHPVSNIFEMADEIRAGRCRAFFKEIPRTGTSATQVTEITIGTKTNGAVPEKYVVKAHANVQAWDEAVRTIRVMEEIARHGFEKGKYRVPKPLGHDRHNLTLIEQGIQGKTLFDKMIAASPQEAAHFLRMAAEWLARLHNCKLQITSPDEFLTSETKRLEFYLSAFYEIKHPHARRAQEIMDTVIETESALYHDHPDRMVQGHGDFHPKNIFIGQDNSDGPSSSFVAAIDFDSSNVMPPSFDVGTFLTQFKNQFYANKQILEKVSEKPFLDTYLYHISEVDNDFLSQVEIFKARTSLSICYYLIKIGQGESENLWRVLVEAEHSIAQISAKGMGK